MPRLSSRRRCSALSDEILPGQMIRHSVGRSKPTMALVVAVRKDGLLVCQAPGEEFGKFVPPNEATPIEGES